jgi:hypothetical protein
MGLLYDLFCDSHAIKPNQMKHAAPCLEAPYSLFGINIRRVTDTWPNRADKPSRYALAAKIVVDNFW